MTRLSDLQKEQLRGVAEPIWRNIIRAARAGDYARFSRGFSSELRAKLSEQHFRDSREDYPLLTSITDDFEFIDSINRDNGLTILWRLRSDKFSGEFLGQLTLHSGARGMEITAVSVT